MKLFGLFLLLFAIASILYEKVWRPERFAETPPLVKLRFAITDWGLAVIAVVLIIFAPWSCQ